MKRQALDDGRWIDLDKCERWSEGTRWDGHNHVSLCAEKFGHEELYRTKSGKWILHHWSQWEGSRDTWTEIENDEAARWLVTNEHEEHEACTEEYAALEVE
jgi:hypothetical protein